MDRLRRACPLSGGLLILALPARSGHAQQPTAAPTESRRDTSADVPDGEKIRTSAQWLKHMRDALGDVFAKLKEARDAGDVVKATCLSEYLTQMKALLRVSEQADIVMQEGITKHEQSVADHEFTKLTIAQAKVDEQHAKSEECMGQLAFQTVGMTVEVEEPSDIPKQDLTNPPPPTPVLARPPPASPTL